MQRPNVRWIEDLSFEVGVWSADGNTLQHVMARVGNLIVAQAAFEAAVGQRPGHYVILRKGAQVIEECRPAAPATSPTAPSR